MNAKTSSPPPPSSFRNNALQSSSGIESSSSGPNSKPKRQSMNVGSSSASAGPRPLHLALGSVVNASPASSPSISSLGIHTPNDTNEVSVIEASTASSSRGQSPLPLSPTVTSLRKDTASRKRSSISYIPSTPNSPSYLQTNRHDVLDSPNIAPSPLGMGSGLFRTSSLGRKGSKTPRSATFAERASTGSMLTTSDSNIADAMAHLKERRPLTLNEKHADLLHFIAQKESKCLELRSQLAVHEAELLQLKRKWEKIINRGFEKAHSPNTASSTSFSTSPSLAPSPYPPESTSPGNSSAGYFPTLNPTTANAPATVVLEGIKESVQGMSRLIAAGLGSIAQVNPPQDSTSHANVNVNVNAPLPLRLASVSQRRANDSGHGQTESQSSSSTTLSAVSNMTSSSFLSTSTASSATSAASSSSMTDDTTKNSPSDAETESEFGEFTDGQASTRQRSATLTEHLMVQDTGATPTMSPNPHFERRKLRKLRVNEVSSSSLSLSSNANASGGDGSSLLLSDSQHETDSISKEDFDWDDAWDEPASEAEVTDHFVMPNPRTPTTSKNASLTPTSTTTYAPTTVMSPTQILDHKPEDAADIANAKGPLSPVLAIPGLAAMGMGMSTPTTQQMSSWVGSVGKKWGEIKGSSAFTTNQKRASVLLSDIQQTFVSSLISPTSTSDSAASFSNSSYPTPTTPSSHSTLSSNASHTKPPSKPSPKAFVLPNASSALAQPPTRRAVSLIDDSDDESFGESAEDNNKLNATSKGVPKAARMMSASVMVPDSVSRTSKTKNVLKTGGADTKDADDDDWNW